MVLPCGCNSGGPKDWLCNSCGRCAEHCKHSGPDKEWVHIQTLKGVQAISRNFRQLRDELEARS